MPNILHYSPEALKALDETYDYIFNEKHNPIAAQNTIQGIRNVITELKTLDNIGVKVFLPDGIETPYRFVQYKNYLAFYRQIDNHVYIDRILYSKRDYLQILFG